MAWSTRELADLAGTTVNTVRHYHALGLLEAPDRRYNGYKQYRVRHLVRLIQVRRLSELGVPLAEVAAAGNDVATTLRGLRRLDTEAAAEIERLRRARSDIAAILRDHAPADTPRGFEFLASELSDADRSLIHVYTRVADDASLSRLKGMVANEPGAVRREFTALRADADEATRQRLADRIGQESANWRAVDRPWLDDPTGVRRRTRNDRQGVVAEVLRELYNPAQRDVLSRAGAAAHLTLLQGQGL